MSEKQVLDAAIAWSRANKAWREAIARQEPVPVLCRHGSDTSKLTAKLQEACDAYLSEQETVP